jgi:hypothetical protein
MKKRVLILAIVFVAVRIATVFAYRDTLYYYGMVSNQFAIAEAAYHGHWFSWDSTLAFNARRAARDTGRHLPLEEWTRLERSGVYTTFPAQDLPGLGYLIAFTSHWLDTGLTTRYALIVQIALELCALLLFSWCVWATLGERVATLTVLLYVFAYPFIWPIVSHPMRDAFLPIIFAAFLVGVFVFVRGQRRLFDVLAVLLVVFGAILLWVRPTAYYFPLFVAPFVLLARGRSRLARFVFLAVLLVVPWLTFGYPYRLFNVRHYGVPNTHALGRTLWERMGIIENNPYGFVERDEVLVPWVKEHYGKDVAYGSPEMNRLLGEYAWRVIAEDPGYFVKTVARRCLEIAKTPLDFVPPFKLVEYGTSGLSLGEYARAYPGSFAFKVFNRLFLAGFFYGALILTLRMVCRHRAEWREIALLMSPFVYTLTVQILLRFEPRYMATAAWVLVLPIACGLTELLTRRAGRRERPS